MQVQMKTHFKSLSGRRLLLSGAIFFLLSGSAPLLDAKECSRVFEENKEKILSSENYVAEGCVFATGKMISRSGNREIGYSKAKLDAISNVISFLEAKVDWPKKIPAGLRKRIWAEYLKCVPVEMTLHRGEVVYRNADRDRYTVVLAVPEKNILSAPPSFSEIRRTLALPENYRSGKLNLSICLELCSDEIPPSLLEAYAIKLGKEYGENVRQMLLGRNAYSFHIRREESPADRTLPELLQLLNLSPYDPELCFLIGNALEKDGLRRAAQIFFARGATPWRYLPEYAERCRKKIPSRMIKNMPELPEMLFEASVGKVNFTTPELEFLNEYAGELPIGVPEEPADAEFVAGEAAFASNRLSEAFAHYTKSVEREVTFAGCNMAGNAGRRIGQDHPSVALLLQAAVADPGIAYPWIHLAWIYRKLGLMEQYQYCIDKIKTYQLDQWSRQQLDLLTQQ